ncbi:insulinoma-associated protein 2 [Pangasianodon hypophthalmus]|uniref:insulinoma-associated protein 2 n=1 Tax=Pangasianodon hypophthalmus TaxID=310915 RepID=UPI00230713E9|nr:insulinoma-associated protein 2 [Pangasianodon hypophthalmus]
MPRGFLVKRSKRASGGSYRIRHECAEVQKSDPHALKSETPRDLVRAPSTDATAARTLHAQPPEHAALAPGRSGFHSSISNDYNDDDDDDDEDDDNGAEEDCHRPAVPLSAGLKRSPFPRCLSSPAAAESFPVSSIERLLLSSRADMKFAPFPSSAFQQNLKPETKSKPPGRKPKVARKLTFEDEVTTSPVLGLRIKKESPESAPLPRSKKPLGEFICQLCKEEYPDPFSLAQHRCSRIVRVEYRCPECDKVFSCPANLASHRRWHKPRDSQDGKKSQAHEKASVEGKENATDMRVKQQHHPPHHPPHPHPHHPQHQLLFFSAESAQSGMPPADTRRGAAEKCFDLRAGASDDGSRLFERRRDDTDSLAPGYLCARAAAAAAGGGGGGTGEEEEEEEEYACHYCTKKFRRHAYLRKHLAAHQSVHAASYKHAESAPIPFTCHLCGARFPSAEVREKHRLWHALAGPAPGKTAGALMRADLMLPPKPSRMWEVPT